jgi:hypothetical protein
MKGIRDFVNKLTGDGGSYQYSYNPEDQTYTQLSGPGTSDSSLGKRIMATMLGIAEKGNNNRYQYSYNPQDQTYTQLGNTGMKKGGMVKSSASKRADGCAMRGKTKGRIV